MSAHRVSPTGGQVRCTCGAEYSSAASLTRHIDAENKLATQRAARIAATSAAQVRAQLAYVHQLDDSAMVQVSARVLKVLLS